MIIAWIIIVIIVIMSIFLINGKGSWMISGYNMMSKREKEKYDKKKLCRATGIYLLIVAALIGMLMLVTNYGIEHNNEKIISYAALVFGVILIVLTIALIIIMNTFKKK
ncbi:DUF3784 domain-containing protein [Clostridium sp. DL1XJH146]